MLCRKKHICMHKKTLIHSKCIRSSFIFLIKCLIKDNILHDDKPHWMQDYATHAQQVNAFQRRHAQTENKITDSTRRISERCTYVRSGE